MVGSEIRHPLKDCSCDPAACRSANTIWQYGWIRVLDLLLLLTHFARSTSFRKSESSLAVFHVPQPIKLWYSKERRHCDSEKTTKKCGTVVTLGKIDSSVPATNECVVENNAEFLASPTLLSSKAIISQSFLSCGLWSLVHLQQSPQSSLAWVRLDYTIPLTTLNYYYTVLSWHSVRLYFTLLTQRKLYSTLITDLMLG